MQQIVDLQNSAEFAALDTALVSVATDSIAELAEVATENGVTTPLLSDEDELVVNLYGMLDFATAAGEPSHTFVLVNTSGTVTWMRDYGAAANGGIMYVEIQELVSQITQSL